ncbi:MAG: MFS transporter [Fervidicoccaceae archaeon]
MKLGKNPWLLLLSTTLASSLVPFLTSSTSIALPFIARELNISYSTANWINNFFLIPLSALVLIAGRIGDWVGRGKIYLLGLALFAASSALAMVPINSIYWLFPDRAVQGISGALVTSVAVALISEAFPPSMRGRVIGINTMAVYVGLSLGPLLGGALTSSLGWRSIFLFSLAISAISFLFGLKALSLERGVLERPPFLKGFLFACSTALIATGASVMQRAAIGGGIALLGALAFISIMLAERGRGELLHRKLFTSRLMMSYSAAMLNYSATFALTVLLSLYLEEIRGMSPMEAGAILTVQPVIQAILSPVAGLLAEKVDPSLIATFGMGIIAIAIASLLPIISTSGISVLYLSLILLGIGFALFASPNTTAIVYLTPREAYASSLAFLATMRYFGQSISTSIITSVEAIVPYLKSSLYISLEIYIALSVLGTLLSFLARRR